MDNSLKQNYSDLIKTPEAEMALKEFLEVYKRYPVIAFTGPAGVGKSTITKKIADIFGAEVFTELPELNPCLKVIKETGGKVNDITLWGNNQNFFLATDIAEIIKAFAVSQNKPVVFDFALTQPFIFSDMKLSGTWLKSFNDMFEHQFNSLPKPDIVIELKAEDSAIIDRLDGRGGLYIDEEVIKMVEDLNSYYKSGIVEEKYDGPETKVITIDNNLPLSQVLSTTIEQIKKVA